MSNVCLILKDKRIGESLVGILSRKYFRVWAEYDVYMTSSIVTSGTPDILCIDGEGVGNLQDLVVSIRKHSTIPIMFFISYAELKEFEELLEHPGIDYVLKPYHTEEIEIRVNRLLKEKRLHNFSAPDSLLEVLPGLSVNFSNSVLIVDGHEHRLSKTLRYLLELLLEHRGRIVSHEYIYEKLWGDYHTFGERREIRSHTKRLRSVLGRYGEHIVNVKSQGYMFT